jgi:hypothetical protein
MKPLKKYMLRYNRTDEGDNLFICDAEDEEHAVEQLKDAEPNSTILKIIQL